MSHLTESTLQRVAIAGVFIIAVCGGVVMFGLDGVFYGFVFALIMLWLTNFS